MQRKRKVVALVSCVSAKLPRVAPAGDLYTSALFSKARRYAKANADDWYILSAKHGLLAPDAVTEPYELTLNDLPAPARRAWAANVSQQLLGVLQAGDTVLFLAGAKYREGLERPLRAHGVDMTMPMAGMRIGEQLAWLTRENKR